MNALRLPFRRPQADAPRPFLMIDNTPDNDTLNDATRKPRSYGGRRNEDGFRLSFGQIGALATILGVAIVMLGAMNTFTRLSSSVETLAKAVDKLDVGASNLQRDVAGVRVELAGLKAEVEGLKKERAP